MTIAEILRDNSGEILRIAKSHGAEEVRVFGSVARGEAKPDSDVDILVTPGPETSPWFPVGLVQDLEILIGRKVDVVTPKSLHWYIRDKVLKEAVPL